MNIREITQADVPEYFEHCLRHFRESGQDGDVHFHPILDFETLKPADEIAKTIEAIQAPLDKPGWQRIWIAEEAGKILADVMIRSSTMPTTLHRPQFAIGVERSARGQGVGRRMSEIAIAWARLQPTFAWMDLWVFAHNAPAIALYGKLGFRAANVVTDQFRLNGLKIDDLRMSLRLDEIL